MEQIELDLRGLAELENRDTYAAARSAQVRVYWTTVGDLGIHIANVFAPVGSIFWSFDEHREMDCAHKGLRERLRGRGELSARARGICAEVGSSTRSAFATVLLGPLTGMLGEPFVSEVPLAQACLLDRRHMSFAVPDHCAPMVARYLQRQLDALGEEALMDCDEGVCLTHLELPSERLQSKPFLKLLETSVGAVDGNLLERMADDASIAAADLVNWRSSHLAALQHYDRGLSISVPNSPPYSAAFVRDASKVLEFRVQYACRFYPLGALSRLRCWLDRPNWQSLEFAGLREQSAELMDRRLCAFGFVDSNPLQEFGPART
jgi:hypothetical protein